jgi:hypothetical protein
MSHPLESPSRTIALMLALAVVEAGVITRQGADQFFGEVETHPNGKGVNR